MPAHLTVNFGAFMEAFLLFSIVHFIIGLAIMAAGRVLYETTQGWDGAGIMAVLSGAFQLWAVGAVVMALFGGW